MKKAISTLVLVVVQTILFAQHPHYLMYYSDSTLNERPWSNIVKDSLITTGVLWDHARLNTPFHKFNGTIDSNTFLPEFTPDSSVYDPSYASFYQPYLDYIDGLPSDSGFLTMDSLMTLYDNEVLRHNAIPLFVYDFRYNQVDSLALYDNSIVNNSGLFEIDSFRTGLFPEHHFLCLAGTHLVLEKGKSYPFVLSPTFLFSDTDSSNVQYAIDFGDGNGFQDLNMDQPKKVTYSGSTNTYGERGFPGEGLESEKIKAPLTSV